MAKTGNTCKWGSYTSGATMTPTSNTTLTAVCTANTYTITFNANGGQTSTSSKKVTYGSTYGDLPVPTYSGYTFLGWYTSATGGTNVITSNQTLYAQWKATCSNTDDDGNCITTTTYKTGDAITLGGYKWYVIWDDGSKVALLMKGHLSKMAHTSATTAYWNNSSINSYLNSTFLNQLVSNGLDSNKLYETSICKGGPSSTLDYSWDSTYKVYDVYAPAGWTREEINSYSVYQGPYNVPITGDSKCYQGYTKSKVRLLTYVEAYNLYRKSTSAIKGNSYITPFDSSIINDLKITENIYDVYGNYLRTEEQYWATTSYSCARALVDTPCIVSTSGVGGYRGHYSKNKEYVRPVIVINK